MAKPSSKIRVVNPVWNGNGIIKRKVAEFYVAEGRAEWVGTSVEYWREDLGKHIELDQLRLIPEHPKNQAAAARATQWERQQPRSERSGGNMCRFVGPRRNYRRWRRVVTADGVVLLPPGERELVKHTEGHEPPMRTYKTTRLAGELAEIPDGLIAKQEPRRPWTMRQVVVGSKKNGISHEWQAFTPLTPEQVERESEERKRLRGDSSKRAVDTRNTGELRGEQ